MKQKLFGKIFFLILFLGFFVRFFHLGQIPTSLYWDEAAMLIEAKTVAATGFDMHNGPWYQLMYPSYGDYKLPVYIWLASLSVKFFGVNAWALRLPSALAGIGTILVTGLIARYLFKNSEQTSPRYVQLTTMLVVALSPWSILFSRTAFEGHLAQFFVGLSMAILLWAESNSLHTHHSKNQRQEILFTIGKFSLAALIGSLATYTYFSVRFVWPIVFLSFQIWFFLKYFWHQPTKTKASINFLIKTLILTTVLPLIIFFLSLIPMTHSSLYEASNQFRFSAASIFNNFDYPLIANTQRQIAGNTLLDRLLFHRHLLLAKELFKNYADHLSLNYLFVNGDQNLRHGTGEQGLFLFTLLPIFVLGIYHLFLKNKRTLLVLFSWWMVALLPASVPETTPHALRSLNALIPLSIIVGVGLLHFIKTTSPKFNSNFSWKKIFKLPSLVFFIFAIALFFNLISFSNHYFNHYPNQSAYDWQDGYNQLAKAILAEKDKVRTVWVIPFDHRFYLWLLAQPDFSASQIQAMPKENYNLTEVENIVFKPFDWEKLTTLDHKLIVVGEPSNLQAQIEKNTLKPNWVREIKSHDGIIRFLMAHYGE